MCSNISGQEDAIRNEIVYKLMHAGINVNHTDHQGLIFSYLATKFFLSPHPLNEPSNGLPARPSIEYSPTILKNILGLQLNNEVNNEFEVNVGN